MILSQRFLAGFFFAVFAFCASVNEVFADSTARETIIYDLSPLGYAQYSDLGAVEFCFRRVNLTVFETHVAGFHDKEKIYSDPESLMPLRVERYISYWFSKEYIVEMYLPRENELIITKFLKGKQAERSVFKSNGPIHNAILLPFSLRKMQKLETGWSYDIRLPAEFKVRLVSVEDVNVPAGLFKAYRFTSNPAGFEIWITNDAAQIPVKIKGQGKFSYSLSMQKRVICD